MEAFNRFGARGKLFKEKNTIYGIRIDKAIFVSDINIRKLNNE